ncbi:RICIN domain-containing protein [Streptomyces cucumeris]|uniref:RICIN domain-containing protein n=1 Tax=Streptomyces cucumeris TaxID=2962890 RepID=UPI003D72E02C
MAQVVSAPDPQHARSPEEFIARLRALKDWSRLTDRELAARAEAAGEALPRTTLAGVLGRAALPGEDLVAAFVRACGVGPAELTVWLSVRADLAARTAPGGGPVPARARTVVPATVIVPYRARADRDDDDGGGPPEPPDGLLGLSSLRRSRAVTLLSVLALTATVVAIAVTTRGSHHGGTSAGKRQEGAGQRSGSMASTSGAALPAPAPGAYRVRAAHSGQCLSERADEPTDWVYQAPCGDDLPAFSLERLDGGYWRIAARHQEDGSGCAGITGGRTVEGAFLVDAECGSRGAGEKFRLEAVARPATGYRLRPVHTGYCLTVPGGTAEPWAHVVQLPCREGESGQVFRFDPVASGARR